MSGNKQNVNRIPQDELAMRSILKDMGVTGTVKSLSVAHIFGARFLQVHFSAQLDCLPSLKNMRGE